MEGICMNEYFESNRKLFRESVARWEDKDKNNIRSLYIKDLNLARTLLLWVYPPFLTELSLIYDSRPNEREVEPATFPGFGQDNYTTIKSDWERDRKQFLKRWNIKMRPENALSFTQLEKVIYPILFARKNKISPPNEINFIPYSDFPSPVRAISKSHERTMSRSEEPIQFQPYEITLTIDTRWSTNDIAKEISKYVRDYERSYCDKREKHQPLLTRDQIINDLRKSLHPQVKTCPQANYYDYFCMFVSERKGYQEIASYFNLDGDQARSTISKAINWVVEFLDYDTNRAKEWTKQYLKKS
jgi:hypothetical protein